MKTSAIALLAIAAAIPLGPANAGPCRQEIDELERSLQHSDLVAAAPQSVDAQLRHQPTLASVARAKASAKDGVASRIEQAKTLEAQGKDDECVAIIAKTKAALLQ